jgi:hypothetical protein
MHCLPIHLLDELADSVTILPNFGLENLDLLTFFAYQDRNLAVARVVVVGCACDGDVQRVKFAVSMLEAAACQVGDTF